jgi:hypothetical protein
MPLKPLRRDGISIPLPLNGAENELSDDSRHGYENGIAWVLLALVPDILSVDIFPSLRNGDVRDK